MKHIFLVISILSINLLYSQNNAELVKEIAPLLKSKSWIDNCFAILRLEKYSKDPLTEKVILKLLKSKKSNWQTKVFAVRAAGRFGISIPNSVFQNLKNPFIAKAALLNGIEINGRYLESCIAANIRSRDIDMLMANLDLCVLANSEKSIKSAKTKIRSLMRQMEPSESITYGDRLCRLLEIEFTERIYWKGKSKEDFSLINAESLKQKLIPHSQNLFVSKNSDEFNEFINYYEGFQETDLDIAIAIDGTGSMFKALLAVKLQTRNLMKTLSALSKSLKLSIVIYRDTQSPKNGEPVVAKFTDDFKDLMKFLAPVLATGGFNDDPESILSGIQEVQKLKWRDKSTKHLVILGDAPSHGRDLPGLEASIIELLRKKRVKTHTLAYITAFNDDIDLGFEKLAKLGNGRHSILELEDNNFSKTILKYSMEPIVFDEFYKVYTAYCF